MDYEMKKVLLFKNCWKSRKKLVINQLNAERYNNNLALRPKSSVTLL